MSRRNHLILRLRETSIIQEISLNRDLSPEIVLNIDIGAVLKVEILENTILRIIYEKGEMVCDFDIKYVNLLKGD